MIIPGMLFFPIFFDPIFIGTMILGYIVMFIVAQFLAPKIANKFSGRFTLYTSMIIISLLIIFSFSAVIFFVIYESLLYFGYSYTVSLIYFSIIFVIGMNIITYLISPYIINLIYGAKEDEELQKIVDEVREKLGIKFEVKAYVVNGSPNAFSYGNFLTGRRVAVARSLMNIMNKEELESVIGHELGHHLHKDNLIIALFGILPSILYYIGYNLLFSAFWGNERNSSNIILALIGLLAVIVSFIVQILVLAFNRMREYYADSVGAKVSKDGMIKSLAKLYMFYESNNYAYNRLKSSSFRALFIYAFVNTLANPFVESDISKEDIERIKNEKINPLSEFMSTHPPIPKRIKFIELL